MPVRLSSEKAVLGEAAHRRPGQFPSVFELRRLRPDASTRASTRPRGPALTGGLLPESSDGGCRLLLKVAHEASDAGGLKEGARQLGNIYTRLSRQSHWRPEPNRNASRSLAQVARHLPPTAYPRIFLNYLKELKKPGRASECVQSPPAGRTEGPSPVRGSPYPSRAGPAHSRIRQDARRENKRHGRRRVCPQRPACGLGRQNGRKDRHDGGPATMVHARAPVGNHLQPERLRIHVLWDANRRKRSKTPWKRSRVSRANEKKAGSVSTASQDRSVFFRLWPYQKMIDRFSHLADSVGTNNTIFPIFTNLGPVGPDGLVFDRPASRAWIIPPAGFPPFCGVGLSGYNGWLTVSTASFPSTRQMVGSMLASPGGRAARIMVSSPDCDPMCAVTRS